MIDISTEATTVLNGYSYRIYFRLQSWLAGEVIEEDIPAFEVEETHDATLRVPERLTFRVPMEVDGVSWVPTSFTSPLGCYGQRILAQVGVGLVSGTIEWINRGVYLLESAETDGSSIAVECLGLLQLLDEAELAIEFQPTAGETLGGTLRQLIEPGLTVDLANAPTDRTVPTSAVTWSDNRLDDVFTILEAWPAQGRVTNEGVYTIFEVPEDPEVAESVFSFTDGAGGTVVDFSANITRDGAFNAVIAQGTYDDDRGALAGLPIIHTWYDSDVDSPYSLYGNFSPFFVPYKFESPLLNEHVPVLLAAEKKLVELRRKASRTVRINCVPHPALELYDAVSVTSERLGLSNELGRIDSFRLSYEADAGAMEITVRLSGVAYMDINGLRDFQQTLVVRGVATSTVGVDKIVYVNFLGTTVKCRATRSITIAVGDIILAMRSGRELIVIERLLAAAPTVDPSEPLNGYPPNPWASVQTGSSTIYPHKTRSFRDTSGWRSDTFDLLQGKWGTENNAGCAFYNDAASGLVGSEVLSATIKIKRDPGSGWTPSGEPLTLKRIEEKNLTSAMVRDKTGPTYISGTEDISHFTGSTTYTLPVDWGQDIADGTAGGLAIHTNTEDPKARLEGKDDWGPSFAMTLTWRRVI